MYKTFFAGIFLGAVVMFYSMDQLELTINGKQVAFVIADSIAFVAHIAALLAASSLMFGLCRYVKDWLDRRSQLPHITHGVDQ